MTSIKNLTGIIMALAFSVAVAAQTSPTPTGQPSPLTPPLTQRSAAVSQAAATSTAQTNKVTGDWSDTYGYQWWVSQDGAGRITGLAEVSCPVLWTITGTAINSSFILLATNPSPGTCADWFQYDMTFTSQTTAIGTWTNSIGNSGGVSMTMTASCTTLLDESGVVGPVFGGGGLLGGSLDGGSTNVSASFSPSLNGVPYTLDQAAKLCGFASFDWVQTITKDADPIPFFFRSNAQITTADVPFSDPPKGGGYSCPVPTPGCRYVKPDNSFPFYYDPNNGELLGHESGGGYTLTFYDAPGDPCLPGPLGLPSLGWLLSPTIRNAYCDGIIAPKGSDTEFMTHLAGVQADGSAVDLEIGFTWKSNFNGTFGGLAQTKSDASVPPDPGSGNGGITLLGVNRTTTYEYLGTPVTPPVLLAGSQVRSRASESEYETGVCASHLVITNVSGAPIVGPFQIVFLNLKSDVVLQNALNGSGQMNMFGGFPFITVPDVSSMAAGESTRISLQFSAGSEDQCESIRYTPLVYTGTLIN